MLADEQLCLVSSQLVTEERPMGDGGWGGGG